MQYHNMLKQKHEQEAKAAVEAAEKQCLEQAKVNAERQKILDEKARIEAAERAAQELIKQEEREKNSKKSFNGRIILETFDAFTLSFQFLPDETALLVSFFDGPNIYK